MSASFMSITDIVKAHDRDRYIATLFAPEPKRNDLLTLYAFDAEVSRIRIVISDPLPGEIRLQWWREVINGQRAGDAIGNVLASGIRDLIARHALPVAAFEAYFDAKIFEFYNDPFPDTLSMEAWCGETSSAIMQMAALILDRDAAKICVDAAGHGGVAFSIANIIQRLPVTRARGQCFLPNDLLQACGNDRDAYIVGSDRAKIKSATDALCALGASHLAKFKLAAGQLPISVKPAYLPAFNSGLTFQLASKPLSQPAFEIIAPTALRGLFGIIHAALR